MDTPTETPETESPDAPEPDAPEKPQKVYASMAQAAAALKLPLAHLKLAKRSGCLAISANGRVDANKLIKWLAAHPELFGDATADTIEGLRKQFLREQVRKLKLRTDHDEGQLVRRSWVVERFHLFGGDLDTARAKSEAEHPLLFAAAAGDVPACREIVRRIWDDILRDLNALKGHLGEGDDKGAA